MDHNVVTEDVGDVRYIRFDRPEKLNALRRVDVEEATRAMRDAAATMRVAVFTGTGDRAFSAGMDVDTFVRIVAEPDTTREVIGAVRTLLDTVRTAEIPTICAVNGFCLGAAFELALACDLRVSVPEAGFGLPELALGLPCIMDSALLHQYVGLARAKEIILTAGVYGANRMLEWGLLNAVVEPGLFAKHVADLATGLAGRSRAGLASQKRLFEVWQNTGLADGIDTSIDEIDRVFHEPETARIVAAAAERLDRRRPS